MAGDALESLGQKLEPGNNVYVSMHPDTREDADPLVTAGVTPPLDSAAPESRVTRPHDRLGRSATCSLAKIADRLFAVNVQRVKRAMIRPHGRTVSPAGTPATQMAPSSAGGMSPCRWTMRQ